MMKQIKMVVFGTLIIMTGCTNVELGQQDNQRIPLEFSVNNLEMTRATGDQQGAQFDDGTEVLMNLSIGTAAAQTYYFKYKSAENLLVPLTASGGSETTLFYPEGVSGSAETDVTINYAYTPATKAAGSVSVETDQTSTPNYKMSDLVWLGSTTLHRPASYTTTPVLLSFRHLLTKFSFKVAKGTGIGKITSIVLKGMNNSYTFAPSAAQASVVMSPTGSQDIAVALGVDLAGGNYYTAVVPAQTISGSTVFLEVTTDVGIASYKIDANKDFVAGIQYTLDLKINYKDVNKTTTITGWSEATTPQMTIGTIDDASFVYDGTVKVPEPTVTCQGVTLTKDVDYILTYSDNVNAGTATVAAVGIGTYAGNVATANFNIRKAAGTISFSKNSATIPSGVGSYTNPLTKTGDGTVTYTSGTTSVATINNSTGTVSLVASTGSSVITATVADGENYTYASHSATYTLTVTNTNTTLAALKTSKNVAYVGYCVSSDGYLFASGDDCVNSGKTPIGFVAYVGNSTPDASNSGYRILVLALKDRDTYVWCRHAGVQCTNNPTTDVSVALTYLDGISKSSYLDETSSRAGNVNVHKHTACQAAMNYDNVFGFSRPSGASIWFLPSLGQWNLIAKALIKKANGTPTDLTTSYQEATMSSTIYNSIITNAGGTGLSSLQWASTEYSNNGAWFYEPKNARVSNWTSSGWANKFDYHLARAAFAY